MGSPVRREKREGVGWGLLNPEDFQHLEVRKKGENQRRKLRRRSQGMSKSVRTQWRGCQERGGLPRSAWSRAAGVERGADGPGGRRVST